MNKLTIDGTAYKVDDRLEKFIVTQKPSSNVEFFGYSESDAFVQFRNGSTYVYKDVDSDTIKDMKTTESIGKFVGARLKKFSFKHYPERMVTRFPEPAI